MTDLVNRLDNDFDYFRRVKGDGNCYYRAVGYAYLEHLARLPDVTSLLEFR
jgi:hypothetical protein